jgi:urease accessory protein
MCGGDFLSEAISLQRAVGELRVGVKRLGSETVLDGLRQVGCLKARFPRRVVPNWMDVVTLNTGGGVAGGDRLDLAIHVGAGCQATVAAQAAERFYRTLAADAPSLVRTQVEVEAGGAVEWLPQDTILFDRCALDRRLQVDLAADAQFIGVETLVFGRAAMGERVRGGFLRDLIRVRRGGALLLHDAIRLDGEIDTVMQRAAVGNGARVLATVVYVAPDATEKLIAVRSSWQTPVGTAEAAASAWSGMMVARIVGFDSASVRAMVVAALSVLRDARPLPRVWLC